VFVDLYCPAYAHEVETEGAVTLDRVELFCRAAGVGPSAPRIRVPEAATLHARRELGCAFGRRAIAGTRRYDPFGRAPDAILADSDRRTTVVSPELRARAAQRRPVIGLAPYATHVSRSWQGRERAIELARGLASLGCRLVLFHSWKCARPGRDEASARELGAYPALRLPWSLLAAFVAECDLVVSVDTGILHLAGALGVPTLGLFGSTSGEVVCRPYPAHRWLASEARPAFCRPPCYGRPARGYERDRCGRAGCRLLARIDPEQVLEELERASLALAR
jgi:ADP-heptose:LPS heptosyltransferase